MTSRADKHWFEASPTLRGEKVFLRRLVPSDAPGIVDISFFDGVAATSDADALAMLRRIEDDQARGECLHWGLCLAGTDEVVGTCGFYRGFQVGLAEVGYVLRESVRGKGVMSSALRLVATFAKEEMGLLGVVAYTDPSNAPSIVLLERLGFRREEHDGDGLRYFLDLG